MTAWSDRAEELAEFTMLHLVNRRDVWGQYLPLSARRPLEDGDTTKAITAPWKNRRGIESLQLETIGAHYRGNDVGHIVGLHTTSAENTSRFLVFDLEDRAERGEANRTHVALLVETLRAFGLSPLVEVSCDRGGRHVWVIFHEPVPTPRVYAFAAAVVAELALPHCETYPKQRESGRFGNWLRLPGRHHTRAHWSAFEVDGQVLEDEDAVEVWLSAWLSNGASLPVPRPVPKVVPLPVKPREPVSAHDDGRRVRGYIDKVLRTGLGAGEGRNQDGYKLACFCVRDLQLSEKDAVAYLAEWNGTHRTPMSTSKLESLVAEAKEYGTHSFGAAG
jgi:putative DNA primase/helicase